MRTRGDKRTSRKHDPKVLVAKESTKSWADTDSESSSSSSSSSDSEQEEFHCFMADQTSDDEVFDFSNIEFTREDLFSALNDMVKEYRNLSHSFEEVKSENISLKSSSIESSSDELEDIDSLKIELRKLTAENDLLRNESSELKIEVEKLTKQMSSWNQSARALHNLHEIQKSVHDRTGLGFNSSDSSEGETSTQSQPAYDKFNKMSFVKANVIYDCYESIIFDDQKSPKLSDNGKAGISFSKPENSKPSWLKNRLDKDKAKASRKPFVPNQPWHSSTKVKSGRKKVQQKRDLYGQHMKSKLRVGKRFSRKEIYMVNI
ncbi:125 kDa kinesin-related protein [Dorcoceras hygrometricum]|uniref:125 kDa kinesin-related protein n=1 Tax=Dorcoceras hygrometricum TaxID=472368 RepID=A0A2Z7A8U1_9LAMI|nr:125 kDa kinesin-related protein [Dorcoceras hygrometricum]